SPARSTALLAPPFWHRCLPLLGGGPRGGLPRELGAPRGAICPLPLPLGLPQRLLMEKPLLRLPGGCQCPVCLCHGVGDGAELLRPCDPPGQARLLLSRLCSGPAQPGQLAPQRVAAGPRPLRAPVLHSPLHPLLLPTLLP